MSSLSSIPWKQRWRPSFSGSRPNTATSLGQIWFSTSATKLRARGPMRASSAFNHQIRTCPPGFASVRQSRFASWLLSHLPGALLEAPAAREAQLPGAGGGRKNGRNCFCCVFES